MELKPIKFSGGVKSISDDDLCANCKQCEYRPGEMSGCKLNWPGLEDADGYVQKCDSFKRIDNPEENWVDNLVDGAGDVLDVVGDALAILGD